MKIATLGMASPFISSGTGALDNLGFMAKMAEVRQRKWDGLHVSLERENFTSPFSQHWLMRTRLCWSHQPN